MGDDPETTGISAIDEAGEDQSSDLLEVAALESENERIGTTASARFNVLSTMVGGGSLSLPLAFQQSGNLLTGPLIMIITAMITEFCFRIHINSARILTPVTDTETKKGTDSYESIAAAAFGNKMYIFGAFLVTSMCFFGTVGYAVLLRDMLQPVTNRIWGVTPEAGGKPTLHSNLTMLSVVLLTTPLCTLRNLSALERFGAFGMLSVLILGSCVVFRSVQCNLGYLDIVSGSEEHGRSTFELWPESWRNLLNAFPLYVSCFVCHYNLLPVHNELRHPSLQRVEWWLRSTTWTAAIFYLIIGFAGSAYGKCTPSGKVQGNVLLDFADDDPLLMVGRICLATTLTMAFPMLTIPGRDILLKAASASSVKRIWRTYSSPISNNSDEYAAALQEPLLENDEGAAAADEEQDAAMISRDATFEEAGDTSVGVRLAAAVLVLWSAAAVASFCKSIDIVWDLLGSSLSCLLSYLIPCGSYLIIAHRQGEGSRCSRITAGLLLAVYTPMMMISTINAIRNTFFGPKID